MSKTLKVLEKSLQPTNISLQPMDAALILREDGTVETSIPTLAPEVVPDHVITSAAIVYALQDEELVRLIRENFQKVCKSLN